MDSVSELLEKLILNAIENYDNSSLDNPFENLISFGELVDRLSIVNFKLFNLKNNVMNKHEDIEFKAWAATEDVALVKERARLKKCIDEKLLAIIGRLLKGDISGGFNPETKKYGR